MTDEATNTSRAREHSEKIVLAIIKDKIPNAADEVKDVIARYAWGLPKIALKLSEQQFETVGAVEEAVGIPIEAYTVHDAYILHDKL